MAVDPHVRQDLEHISTVEAQKIEVKRDFPSSFEDNITYEIELWRCHARARWSTCPSNLDLCPRNYPSASGPD